VNNMLDWILSNFSLSLSLCVVVTRLKLHVDIHVSKIMILNSQLVIRVRKILYITFLFHNYFIMLTLARGSPTIR